MIFGVQNWDYNAQLFLRLFMVIVIYQNFRLLSYLMYIFKYMHLVNPLFSFHQSKI